MAQQLERAHGHSVAVAFHEEIDGQQAEEGHHRQHDAHSPVHRLKNEIQHHARQPEAEMGEDVHHRVEDDRRSGLAGAHVRGQLHDAVGLPAHQSHGSGIVQGKAGNGQLVHFPERHLGMLPVADDDIPRPGVQVVDEHPQQDDGRKPDTGFPQVLPEFLVVHVERAEHDHDGKDAEEPEYVAKFLFH